MDLPASMILLKDTHTRGVGNDRNPQMVNVIGSNRVAGGMTSRFPRQTDMQIQAWTLAPWVAADTLLRLGNDPRPFSSCHQGAFSRRTIFFRSVAEANRRTKRCMNLLPRRANSGFRITQWI